MNKTVTIGLPLPQLSEYATDVSWECRKSLDEMKKFSATQGITTWEKSERSVNVAMNHVACANNMKGEWLLIVGSDHTFAPQALLLLLEAAYGLEGSEGYKEEDIPEEPVRKIIGAITPFRSHPYRWVAVKFDKYKNRLFPIVPYVDFHPGEAMGGSVIEVDAVGSGVCLYHRSVFETVPFPWFYFATRKRSLIGPDFRLCLDAADLGIKTYLHFGVTSLHWTFAPVTHVHYINYLRSDPVAWYSDANKGNPPTEDTIQELKKYEHDQIKQGTEELETEYARENQGPEKEGDATI